jgi:hypothetical protein
MSMWLLRVRLLGRGCGCGWAVGVAVAVAAVAAVAACRTVTVAATAAAWLRLLSWGCRSVDVAVRIELSSNLPQKICKIIEFRAGNESFSFRKNGFQHFRQKSSLHYGCRRNRLGARLGQHVRIDHGIITGFHESHDFDKRFTGQTPCFPENLDFYFLRVNNLFIFGTQILRLCFRI